MAAVWYECIRRLRKQQKLLIPMKNTAYIYIYTYIIMLLCGVAENIIIILYLLSMSNNQYLVQPDFTHCDVTPFPGIILQAWYDVQLYPVECIYMHILESQIHLQTGRLSVLSMHPFPSAVCRRLSLYISPLRHCCSGTLETLLGTISHADQSS